VSERFYCPDPPRAGRYRLGPEESRHLARVCRIGVGDRVEIFDGRGFVSGADVVASAADGVELVAAGEPIVAARPACSLVLASAMPKGERLDWLIEKATELGVDRLIPIIAERSVVLPRGTKLNRLRRSIVEASKQCRRARLMVLEEPVEWGRLVTSFPAALRLLADPRGAPPPDWPPLTRGRDVVLAVGPEGSFTAAEREHSVAAGWLPIRLGHNILRVETAGLAGCAALLARLPEDEE
jgi:16S rRNA (uracil1498-N3)-methyltransferase